MTEDRISWPAAKEEIVFTRFIRLVVLMGCLGGAAVANAQYPAAAGRPYDGIQAGLDAFRLAEDQRQAAVADQLAVNDAMRFINGYPTSRGETIYYGYLSPSA